MGWGLGGCSEIPVDGGGSLCWGAPRGSRAGVGLPWGWELAPQQETSAVGERRSWCNQQRGKGVLTRPLLSNGLPEKEKEECQQSEGTTGVLVE